MHLDDGDADGADAVGQGDGSVGIGSRVHHHGVKLSIGLLQLVDEAAFMIGLVVNELMLRELRFEMLEMGLKRGAAVNLGLSLAEQVEVGAVENEDFHLEIFLQK